VEIQKRVLKTGAVRWKVRWRQGDRYRSQTFDRKGDAVTFAAEIRRRQQLGTLVSMDSGRVTLAAYVINTWAPAYGSNLARKTQLHYEQLLVKHVLPELGPLELRAITPETIARWQADRLADGYGRVAIRHAFDLLGSILQRAFEGGQIQTNPARAVRKAPRPRRAEVGPLPPVSIERMRAGSTARDATLISVLAYAGLRPGEALALQWRDIREQTILVERAVSLGEEKTRRPQRIAPFGSCRRSLLTSVSGACEAAGRETRHSSFRRRPGPSGASRRINRGGAAPSSAHSTGLASSTRAHTTSAIRSPRFSFTRAGR
jgi:integrase